MNPKELTTPEKRRYPVPNRILPVKDMKSNPDLRLRTVQYAPKHSNSEASRVFGTTGDTIRKWVERYLKDGPEGLIDRHRRLIHSTHRIPDGLEKRILSFREDFTKRDLRTYKGPL